MQGVSGLSVAVSRGMGKVGQNSSCLIERGTSLLVWVWFFFSQCVFSPLVKEMK